MATFWIGTSGYAYKQWKGRFYPETLPDAEMLRYYGTRFSGVEINYTFYRFASVRQLQSWAKEVPDHFTFTLKAPRRVTHELRLRDAADMAADFCETARALKQKLGALLFQLPPFLKRDTPRLSQALRNSILVLRHDRAPDDADIGAIGDGHSHPLEERYGTNLEAAQKDDFVGVQTYSRHRYGPHGVLGPEEGLPPDHYP
jgi:hypothetical protein